MDNQNFKHAIVIQTNLYSGNFEREMCAYITGSYGECEVGEEIADMVNHDLEIPLYEYTDSLMDDNGCRRPVSIYMNENHEYNDVIIFFETRPTDEMMKMVRERAEKFAQESRNNIGAPRNYGDYTQIQCGDLNILGLKRIERKVQVEINEEKF